MANQTTVQLPLMTSTRLRKALSVAVVNTAKYYEAETRQRILSSVPSGRLYKRRGGFHRASAKGQRPAVDTANLLRSFRTRELSMLRQIVEVAPNRNPRNGAKADFYAAILQFKRDRKIMTDDDAKQAEKVLDREVAKAVRRLI